LKVARFTGINAVNPRLGAGLGLLALYPLYTLAFSSRIETLLFKRYAEPQKKRARFRHSDRRMVAPTDGMVVNWQVQDGTMLASLPLAPAGTFINTSETVVAASFPQSVFRVPLPLGRGSECVGRSA
jgi:hypothetical protein